MSFVFLKRELKRASQSGFDVPMQFIELRGHGRLSGIPKHSARIAFGIAVRPQVSRLC